tara:strand:- start:23059 stop:25917 length:2859 start_codon:yes stop_codon:yes gene_type:complete
MAKIKINKLPKGFELVDGKVQESKSMQEGGMITGDQADYGLVTTPQTYYGSTNFNNTKDDSVRYSLSSVPRDNANVEAEGGETVLTDLNDDGNFGLYDITGPRHSKGGVPMFLPEQSFIYSDTPKLKFGKEEMSELDIAGDRKTPAKLSKRFGLNDYYGELDSQYADNISSLSAELMLKKNMSDLSKLAFMQESKKSFSDGVPLAAHPYLVSIGEDPIKFTAQVEQITEEQAKREAIAALSPEQQQQIMMLQQFMAQAQEQQQAPQQQQQAPAQGSFEQMQLADANSDLMLEARFGGNLDSYQKGGQKASDFAKEKGQQWPEGAQDPTWNGKKWEFDDGRTLGMMEALRMANKVNNGGDIPDEYKVGYDPAAVEETVEETVEVTDEVVENVPVTTQDGGGDKDLKEETVDDGKLSTAKNPYKKGSDNYNKLEEYRKNGYELTVVTVDGKKQIRAYKPYDSKFKDQPKVVVEDIEGIGTGETSVISEENQAQGEVLENSPIGSYRPGIYSGGNRPTKQGTIYSNQVVDGKYDPSIAADTSSGVYAYGSAQLKSDEGKADFENRWGDVTKQIEGFDYSKPANDPQWKEFQVLAEETRKKEAEQLGIPYVPHFKKPGDEGYVQGEGYDGALGMHTFNTPRLDVDFTSQDEQFMDVPVKEEETPKVDLPEKRPARAEWWKQDENNLNTLMGIEDELFLPFAPTLEEQKVDYVLDDYTGRVNANNASLNTMSNALKAYGPQALERSNVFGKTLDANAKTINQVNSNNVKTMNQVATLQPQLDLQVDVRNAAKDTKLYDDTITSLQNAQNFSNWKTAKANELYNTGITNAANTANMNDLYDYYDINPQAAGRVQFGEDGKQLYKDSQQPQAEAFKDWYTDIQGQFPDQELNMTDALKVWGQIGGSNKQTPNTTLGAQEASANGLPGYPSSNVQITRKSRNGREMKRFAVPFYSGTMGV